MHVPATYCELTGLWTRTFERRLAAIFGVEMERQIYRAGMTGRFSSILLI
jgi:hypothetical protein